MQDQIIPFDQRLSENYEANIFNQVKINIMIDTMVNLNGHTNYNFKVISSLPKPNHSGTEVIRQLKVLNLNVFKLHGLTNKNKS